MTTEGPEYYEGDVGLPIFIHIPPSRKRLFTAEDIVCSILWPSLDKRHVCSKVPIAVSHNVSFLVDTDKLADPMDILCDDMGSWKNNRVDSIPVAVSKGSTEITSVQRLATSSRKTKSNYTLRRVYRVHRTDKTLKKIIASLYGQSCITNM
jgi:hypothetical protein